MITKIFNQLEARHERMPKVTGIGGGAIQPSPPLQLSDPKQNLGNNAYVKEEAQKNSPTNGNNIRADLRQRMDTALAAANERIKRSVSYSSIRFAYHEESGYAFAMVRDRDSGEVLRKIPAEEFLDMAAKLQDASGIFVNTTG
ncbi:MAG: flagellar protein FlaG [Deltaproteobacteria bacterium]|nr:flagellar protein FlaG [Deltaproteobacteria bacterium]